MKAYTRRHLRYSTLFFLIFITLALISFIHFNYDYQSDMPFSIFMQHTNKKTVKSIWSTDFHISPVADIKHILKESFGVKMIDKSLSAHCHITHSCQTDLQVLTFNNGITLGDCPIELRRKFYDTYQHDSEFQAVDAILCTHASSLCEVYMPFGKPLIVIASTRYDIGRNDDADSWVNWNENLRRISHNPRNTIAANNKYDQEYIRYFTGLNIELVPSYCGYVTEVYEHPAPRAGYLVGPSRGINSQLLKELNGAFTGTGLTFHKIRDLYPYYEFSDLVAHPGIIILPYQVSFMSLFEYYRMAIPLFVPSVKLLAQWHIQHGVLFERTWDRAKGLAGREQSLIPKFEAVEPNANSSASYSLRGSEWQAAQVQQSNVSLMQNDPNNELSYDAIVEWIQLADFYQWPHITTFDSWQDLQDILVNQTSILPHISSGMKIFNEEEKKRIEKKWDSILARAAGTDSTDAPSQRMGVIADGAGSDSSFIQAMLNTYDVEMNATDCSFDGDGIHLSDDMYNSSTSLFFNFTLP